MGNKEYCFSEKLAFWKCNSSENVNAVQKYLLRKSSSSVDIFILKYSSTLKEATRKSYYPKEICILKRWLLGRSFALEKLLFWKNNYCKKVTCAEIVTRKKCEKVAPLKLKLSWKSHNKCEKGIYHLKKKNNPRLN